VKNTSVKIVGKLELGLVGLYTNINEHAQKLDIKFLVVGAMARDLVLVHGYGSNVERGTRDVDFGINIASWDEFNALKERLIQAGYKADKHKMHQLNYIDEKDLSWEIDIVPFGEIADIQNNISWPPGHEIEMNVMGFPEAFANALNVQISENPETIIPVASPVGICLLKLVAWLDRKVELRAKDATDFVYIIESYRKIPEIYEALFDQGYMEAQEWDDTKASAMKLGQDVSEIASKGTKEFLQAELFKQEKKSDQLVRDMEKNTHKSLSQCAELFSIFADAFLGDDDL
jgi:predicted nucleotidyltransferase